MEQATELLKHGRSFVAPALVLLLTVIAGAIAKRLIFRALERWAQRSTTRFDNAIVDALRAPFTLWTLILGLHLATQISSLPDRVTHLTSQALLILWITSLTLVGSKLAGGVIQHYGAKSQGALPVTSLSQNLARLVVVSFGALILLNQLGLSITPILTALGVGGLAVALALQDTLTNLFAGFYVSVAGQIRVGDYIKLNTGEEGYVSDIGWRSTTIRALPHNMIIVPNAKLSQAIVTNYYLPDRRMSLSVAVAVSFDSDPDRVEKILIEEACRAATEVPGLLAQPAPFVRLVTGFSGPSLEFTLICHVREFTDQFLVQHELRKRILRRFRREGVHFPSGGPAAPVNGSCAVEDVEPAKAPAEGRSV